MFKDEYTFLNLTFGARLKSLFYYHANLKFVFGIAVYDDALDFVY